MNIVYLHQLNPIIAKTCGCNESGRQKKVTYAISEEFHSLCMDKRDVLQAEVKACERLLKNITIQEAEREIIVEELTELKMTLDLLT